ncbi:MAG: TetR/AcrR family transcriptional regulator [Pseudomonadales bacterium]|jgi:AcrR family transcriptional regulator
MPPPDPATTPAGAAIAGARVTATRARKQSVLSAALDCFTELGVEQTTISEIQRRANCSIGSIYHHFGSKEGIAEELFLDGIQRLNRGMLKKIRAAENAREGVQGVVEYYCEWSTRHQDMARYLHSRDIDFSPDARRRLHEIHRAYIGAIFTWFAPFVERGEMRLLPPETYVPLISGPIQEYVRRWLSGHHKTAPRQVKALFADAAWNAVKG